MYSKVLILATIVGIVTAKPQQYGSAGASAGNSGAYAAPGGNVGQGSAGYPSGADNYGQTANDLGAGMPYQFDWQVNDPLYGSNYGHTQQSDGTNVNGRYFVQLPDGRLQTVIFKSDPYTGFQADVQYQGEAKYPAPSASGYGNEGGYSAGGQAAPSAGGQTYGR